MKILDKDSVREIYARFIVQNNYKCYIIYYYDFYKTERRLHRYSVAFSHLGYFKNNVFMVFTQVLKQNTTNPVNHKEEGKFL